MGFVFKNPGVERNRMCLVLAGTNGQAAGFVQENPFQRASSKMSWYYAYAAGACVRAAGACVRIVVVRRHMHFFDLMWALLRTGDAN